MANPDLVEFTPEDRGAVVARMAEVAGETNAARMNAWANFQPGIDPDLEVPASPGGLFGFLSARGPLVPVCTWAPGDRRRLPAAPISIGVQHGSGPKAVRLLAERGVDVPAGWLVLQDHPRRGLVVSVPRHEDHDRVLGWLIEAGRALAVVPLTGDWRAAFYGSS